MRLRGLKVPEAVCESLVDVVRPRGRPKGSLGSKKREGPPTRARPKGTKKVVDAARVLGKDSLVGMGTLLSNWIDGQHSGDVKVGSPRWTLGPEPVSTPGGTERLRGHYGTQGAVRMTLGTTEGIGVDVKESEEGAAKESECELSASHDGLQMVLAPIPKHPRGGIDDPPPT